MNDLVDDFLNRHGVAPTLTHQGVKGMKWGVRKKRSGVVKARATMARGARETVAKANGLSGQSKKYKKAYDRTYRASAKKIRQGVKAINNDPIYKGVSFKHDTPLRRQYYDRISSMMTSQLNASAIRKGQLGSGMELKFNFDIQSQLAPTVTIRQRDTYGGRRDQSRGAKAERQGLIQHADSSDELDELTLRVIYDDDGYIQDFAPLSGDMEHSDADERVAIFLEKFLD